ncbi:MAG: outer membrane protein assembly factor BamE [Endomicrobium sp.]|jgi:choline-glycine betaine transporter|nr:outer membrane protein assembly factor BamE [Endomicrobium sp.]
MKKIAFFLLSFLFIVSCASIPTKMNNLNVGMTKSQVFRILGKPDTVSARENVEILKYHHSYWVWWIRRTKRYFVKLTDGAVNAYGQITRQNAGEFD